MNDRRAATPRLAGMNVVVTGGGRGLGRILAQALADAGASVGVIARTSTELEETARLIRRRGGRAVAATADVSAEQDTAEAIESVRSRLGAIDILVNNAGVNGPIGAFADVNSREWWRAIEINLGGAVNCTKLVLDEMLARRRGRIINVTSVAGTYRWPTVSAYAVSKGALVKFTENVAAEVRGDGVSVFSVHPGLLPIGLARVGLESTAPPGSPQARIAEWARKQRAEGRFSEPARAAAFIVALASGCADRLSGRHLTVDDDIESLMNRLDDVLRLDLYTLRVHALTNTEPKPALSVC
jgi:NAD(P)-dependent dehydrogenase (short-subunit alcohol dehydrogenase family)